MVPGVDDELVADLVLELALGIPGGDGPLLAAALPRQSARDGVRVSAALEPRPCSAELELEIPGPALALEDVRCGRDDFDAPSLPSRSREDALEPFEAEPA